MYREERDDQVFVTEKTVGLRGNRIGNLRAEAEKRAKSGDVVHAHAEKDYDQIGVSGKIDGFSLDVGRHVGAPYLCYGASRRFVAETFLLRFTWRFLRGGCASSRRCKNTG